MSEKNLAIRNKFLSKINNKMTDLNESLALLQKVDRKLIQQSGGSLQALQLSVLQLAQKRNEVEQLSQTIRTLQQNMGQINQRLAALATNITDLNQQFVIPQVDPDMISSEGFSDADFKAALSAKDASTLPQSLQQYSQQLFPSSSSSGQQLLGSQGLSSSSSGQPTLMKVPSLTGQAQIGKAAQAAQAGKKP
jgi:cell division protein FtsB